MTTKEKLNKFLTILDENDELFYSYGTIKKDFEYIKRILNTQGFWAGEKYNYYFDDNMNLTKVKERF